MIKIRGRRAFAAALAALALLAACTMPRPSTTAAAHGGGVAQRVPWTVLAPVSYKNLTIFPVRARDLAGSADYITLDEGTKNGTVVITEKGAGVAARRPRPGRGHAANRNVRQQAVSYDGGSAEVNELALVNKSGRKLLLLAGEVIVGGKQDRIVQEDRIIPPVSVPVALDVFCVEHGRWTPRQAGYGGGGGNAGPRAAAQVVAPLKFDSLGAVAHPKLRGAAQDKKEQGAVWNEVQANNAKLGTSNSTDTYQEVYSSKRVGAQLGDYVRALQSEVLRPEVVGVVVARNGKPVWADVFASHRLFAAYWPKLLKSYAVDALGDDRSDARPSTAQALAYLRERAGAATTTTHEGVYQLVKTERDAYAVFELRDTSLVAPLLLHFNKMDR